MPRFFFDSRDDDDLIVDDEGLEFDSFEAAKSQATKSLALLALDVLPGSLRRRLGIDVKNESGALIFVTELTFEARALA
jgi:hypothetical protein